MCVCSIQEACSLEEIIKLTPYPRLDLGNVCFFKFTKTCLETTIYAKTVSQILSIFFLNKKVFKIA